MLPRVMVHVSDPAGPRHMTFVRSPPTFNGKAEASRSGAGTVIPIRRTVNRGDGRARRTKDREKRHRPRPAAGTLCRSARTRHAGTASRESRLDSRREARLGARSARHSFEEDRVDPPLARGSRRRAREPDVRSEDSGIDRHRFSTGSIRGGPEAARCRAGVLRAVSSPGLGRDDSDGFRRRAGKSGCGFGEARLGDVIGFVRSRFARLCQIPF